MTRTGYFRLVDVPYPTQPAGNWRKAWEKRRVAAGLPTLRMYDLRHHVVTRLLEDPANSERTVTAIAGHVSNRMFNTHSHIRMQPMKEALDRLVRPKTNPARPQFVLLKGGRKS